MATLLSTSSVGTLSPFSITDFSELYSSVFVLSLHTERQESYTMTVPEFKYIIHIIYVIGVIHLIIFLIDILHDTQKFLTYTTARIMVDDK